MTANLPRITTAETIKALRRAGFQLVRQSGSHKIFRNAQGRRVTVPYHAKKILHPKILAYILRDADLSVEELRELLR
ncbi:MAG TPA: type II toxin-antitoxin system HicA family toxin [bacterium]|jgi:predicted RNA binding protein YcfA (HicA-like mRNA interferase family)